MSETSGTLCMTIFTSVKLPYLYSGYGLKPISAYPAPLVLVALVNILPVYFSFFGNGFLTPDIAEITDISLLKIYYSLNIIIKVTDLGVWDQMYQTHHQEWNVVLYYLMV